MSLDATLWAWRIDVSSSSERLVLLSLADRAGEDHKCYPSLQRLIKDTKMNRKTIIKVLDTLEHKKLIRHTGEIRGNGVKVYQLIGVVGRETEKSIQAKKSAETKPKTSTNLGTSSKIGTSTNIDTSTSTDIGTATSTVFGTENLSRNLSIESKNKKTWICLKKLREEIICSDSTAEFDSMINATWYKREVRAFEHHNADKPMSDEIKLYHLADWLLNAKAKYQRRQNISNPDQQPARQSKSKRTENNLSSKQIGLFAQRLAHHPEFASRYGEPGQSYEQLAAWIGHRLNQPKYFNEWAPYLKEIGFVDAGEGAA